MYKVSIDDLIGIASFEMFKWYNKIGHRPAYPGKYMDYIIDKHTLGFIYYGKLSEEEAKDMQMYLGGYHPAGYGFYGYNYNPQYDITTWNCGSSCD